jgi:hypothetical protein
LHQRQSIATINGIESLPRNFAVLTFADSHFDPTQYGSAFAELLQCDRFRSLDEGTPDASSHDELAALTLSSAFTNVHVADEEMAHCCISGIWLLYDFLDDSHTISQSIATTTGSYWHGIMHRREGDFSNSKYWFRKVGDHPIFEQLTKLITPLNARALLGSDNWDPFAFVDACQASTNSAGTDADLCRQLQQREWEILFDYCYAAAVK